MEKEKSLGELFEGILKDIYEKLNELVERTNNNSKIIKRLHEILSGK